MYELHVIRVREIVREARQSEEKENRSNGTHRACLCQQQPL